MKSTTTTCVVCSKDISSKNFNRPYTSHLGGNFECPHCDKCWIANIHWSSQSYPRDKRLLLWAYIETYLPKEQLIGLKRRGMKFTLSLKFPFPTNVMCWLNMCLKLSKRLERVCTCPLSKLLRGLMLNLKHFGKDTRCWI